MSYIINKYGIVAKIAPRATGTVIYSGVRCAEQINANREFNLVNAQRGKISNAKKHDSQYARIPAEARASATEINPGEFFIS